MRITTEAKAATRNRILAAAKQLFRSQGFDRATTRDIAREAGIATGTMFNYFPSKEAVVVELAAVALQKAGQEFARTASEKQSLAEALFGYVAIQLRHLRPQRKYIRPLLETAFGNIGSQQPESAAQLRGTLGESMATILVEHGLDEPSAVALNMLWTLYVGVFNFWESDTSPKQEDTLALLDQSMQMFADWAQ